MQRPIVPHLLWAVGFICAFSAGYLIANPSGNNERRGSTDPAASTKSVQSSLEYSDDRDGERARAATGEAQTPEQLRILAYQIRTASKSRVDRMRRLCDLLPQVTKENWKQILDGWETRMDAPGHNTSENYSILLEHIGAVAGADAMNVIVDLDKDSKTERVTAMLKGWAEADPNTVVEWYLAQPKEVQGKHMGQFLAGVARSAPKKALELTFDDKQPYYATGTGVAVFNAAVAGLGVEGVEDYFTTMRVRADLSTRAKERFFSMLAERKLPLLRKANEPATEVLNWFQTYVGQQYVSADVSTKIVAEAAKANAAATFSWLELQGERFSSDQTANALSVVAAELQRQSPKELVAWLGSQQTHPHRDQVVTGAANALIQAGDFAAATEMINSITNPEKRSEMMATVERQSRSRKSAP